MQSNVHVLVELMGKTRTAELELLRYDSVR